MWYGARSQCRLVGGELVERGRPGRDDGGIYKMALDGTVLGYFGRDGQAVGQFGWIHALACPSANEVWVAELLTWRVQKVTLRD